MRVSFVVHAKQRYVRLQCNYRLYWTADCVVLTNLLTKNFKTVRVQLEAM